MDAFGTALATTTLVVQYVSACAAFASQAESLAARFEWDLRAMQIIKDYFNPSGQNLKLLPQGENLLQRTMVYLDRMVIKAQKKLNIIQRKGFLSQVALGASWIVRRSDLEELEAGLFAWTQRFGVHVLDLNLNLRNSVQTQYNPRCPVPRVVRSNDRLRDFAHLTMQEKKARANHLLLQDANKLASRITNSPFITCTPLRTDRKGTDLEESGDNELIFASRMVSQKVLGDTQAFASLREDMGILAAALNCLDHDANIRLLKVEYYFYHEQMGQFVFAHHPPHSVESMTSLEKLLSVDSFPKVNTPLDQRLKLAYKLAEAVFFLHTADFLHKNITSSSIVVFENSEESDESDGSDTSNTDLANAYLMGFDLIRGAETRTTKEGAVKEVDTSRSIWEFDTYQHADRQQGARSPKYVKVYDVYSLGVVLLEVGMWQPLSTIAPDLDKKDPKDWSTELSDIAIKSLKPRSGAKYSRLVSWCLALDGDDGMKETDFTENVLDPLEEIAEALC